MPDPEISPIPERNQSLLPAESLSGDDIDLPPAAQSSGDEVADLWPTPTPKKRGNTGTLLSVAALVATSLAVGFFMWGNGSTEKSHPNWQHVASATQASSDATSQLVSVGATGATQFFNQVQLSSADINRTATDDVRTALANNDIAAATAALQANQRVSPSKQNDAQLPELTTGSELVQDLQSGKKELFQIELFDCCDEDGDIVEVLVNGQPFATVPIMHAGTMLSIPLAKGDNSIVIRGARDGGGGVTLSVRTSQGEFFTRYLWVGQECEIGMAVQ